MIPAKKRIRRSPEEARALILNAALELFSERGPDAVGLKEVAKQAGVSHALITHYFGTYNGLVEAAFAEHLERARAAALCRMGELVNSGPEAWVDLAADHLSDPTYGRLVSWALMSGRLGSSDFFTHRAQGLRSVVELLAQRFRTVERRDLEFAVLLVMSASLGYALGRSALWGSLGARANAERDAWFRERLSKVVVRLLRRR